MFKVNESNEIDVGGTLNIGTLSLSEDCSYFNKYACIFYSNSWWWNELFNSVDSNVIAKVYAEADSGGTPAFQIMVI